MDIDVPGAAAAQQRATLEEDLASVFQTLLEDTASAQDAVNGTYNVCLGRVDAFRAEAAEQLHRPARHMALTALAEEMEAQAATWQLLFCLYCDLTEPAGAGGYRIPDVGDTSLYRQRLADCVGNDSDLARCARVVSWLESLAEDALKRQGMVAFAPGEGVWHETKTEMRTRSDAMVSELDPDAPGRSGRPLHPSNARSQERILARVWQLMRAGDLVGAQELCRQVGQPWRAAAIGGGGPYGLLPVGIAAAEYDEKADWMHLQVEELADEVANGAGTLAALWRWAAQQAAAAPPGDKFERAVFGALGGSAAAAAPACATWEDFAWVYCRSWLESQAMQAVPPAPQAVGDLVAGDAVTAALIRCGVAPAAAQRSVDGAMAVVMGSGGGAAATAMTLYDSDAAMEVAAAAPAAAVGASRGFGQLFAQHVMSPAAMVNSGPAAVQALRQVQGLLVQGNMHSLAAHLFASLVDRRGGGGGGASAAASSDADGAEDASGAVGASFGGAAAANPERRRRMCAAAAHMLLALEGLGVLPHNLDPRDVKPDSLEVHSTLDLVQRLLGYYTATLLEQEQLSLVPPYLCVLRPALRSSLCGELLALHTRRLTGVGAVAPDGSDPERLSDALAAADAECHAAIVSLDYWFRRCVERQRKPAEERSNFLETDIRRDELRIQLATFTLACRHDREYGPHQRARVARWLALPHVIAAESAAAAAGAAAAAEAGDDRDGTAAAAAAEATLMAASRVDPWCYFDVLDFVDCLCCEFALGDNVTAAAGHRLFAEVLPEDLELAACAAADHLETSAVEMAVAANAADAAAATNANAPGSGGGPVYLFEQDRAAAAAAADADDPERPEQPSAEAAAALAAQLRDRATELGGWRQFYRLDARLSEWTTRHEAFVEAAQSGGGGGGGGGAEALLEEGGELLQDFLEHLLQAGWMQELAAPERALAAASAEGFLRVDLAVTCPPGSSAARGGPAATWGQPTAPYPELQGAALVEFRQALDAGLRRAAAERGVEVEVVAEASAAEAQGHGHVALSLTVAADPQLWRSLVEVVSSLVRGELDGVPQLLLVGLEADRATSLAVCRRCCIGQAVMRCAGLRLSLVGLGAHAESPATGPQLVEMLAAPCGTGLETGLLELLSPAQLAGVLMVEADTYEQHLRNLQVHAQQQRQAMWR